MVSRVQDNSSWTTHIDNICSKAKHSSSLMWLYPAGLYPNVPTICMNSYMRSFLPIALFQTGILYLKILYLIECLCLTFQVFVHLLRSNRKYRRTCSHWILRVCSVAKV